MSNGSPYSLLHGERLASIRSEQQTQLAEFSHWGGNANHRAIELESKSLAPHEYIL